MKGNKFFWAILSFISALYIGTGLLIYRNLHPSIVGEVIICEQRYVGDKYWGEVEAKDGDYIYLNGYRSLDTICTPYEDMVDEETPLCGTQVVFEGPLDTSNMNCYASEDDFKGKLKAFKKQEEDAKAEDKKYYTCDLRADEMVDIYNSCETRECATRECATYRIREYLKSTCPSVTIK